MKLVSKLRNRESARKQDGGLEYWSTVVYHLRDLAHIIMPVHLNTNILESSSRMQQLAIGKPVWAFEKYLKGGK